MPSYKYEFIIDGKVGYTCYSIGMVDFYSFQMDIEGVDYEVVKTSIRTK